MTNYVVVGKAPNAKCQKCPDGESTKNGVTCISDKGITCKYDSEQIICVYKNASSETWVDYEPRTTSKTCVIKCSYD